MSLTSHLKSPGSPVRQFMADRFSQTRHVFVADPDDVPHPVKMGESSVTVQAVLPDNAGPPLILPAGRTKYPWATVGTAVDYRIRYFLKSVSTHTFVAKTGALLLSIACGQPGIPDAFDQLSAALDELVPVGTRITGDLGEEKELQLAHCYYALALYEQCGRVSGSPDWPIIQLGVDASLDEILSLCEDRAATDIRQLAALFLQNGLAIHGGKVFALNPKFAASSKLGGADADLVVDGWLVDIKTTVEQKPKRQELWQLTGYVLADWDDTYAMSHVGFYYSRQGVVLRWPIQNFLSALGGRSVDLVEERLAFRNLLDSMAEVDEADDENEKVVGVTTGSTTRRAGKRRGTTAKGSAR